MSGGPDPTEVGVMLGLLWRGNHELALLSKRMQRTLGVTGPQRLVLRIVSRKPGLSATAIAEEARLHASTLTGILDRLVRAGFLARGRDRADLRRAQLGITPEGQAIADAQRGTVESAIRASLAELNAEERAVVRRWLNGFGEALADERAILGGQDDEDPKLL